MNNLNGLSVVNIELTSRCNKECWMCGRRKLEKDYPELCNWGDIEFSLLEKIAKEIPPNIIIQFHNNGEPLLYPRLKEALALFPNNIKCLNTNGKLLRSGGIVMPLIRYLDTLTISVIENDPEADEQFKSMFSFFGLKDFQQPPLVIFRLLGDVKNKERWYDMAKIHNCLVATRVLHNPMGSFDYEKKVTIPEHGICLDLLTHLVIDRFGDVYPCVRFNPNKINKLGNVKDNTLEQMWNSQFRMSLIDEHIKGNRKCNELCANCDFYGCPTGN